MRLGTLMVATLVGLCGAGPAPARDLTIVSWGGAYQDAQREVYFRPFSHQAGLRLLEESWTGGIGVLRARMRSPGNTWDLVQVEREELLLGCDEGLFERLDYARIGGREHYLPEAVHECGVGTILYNLVLAWDRDRHAGTPTWVDFFAVDRIPGKRGLRRGVKMALEIALMGDGVPPGEVYPMLATEAGVDRAFRLLDRIKPHISWWQSPAQAPQMLSTGEVLFTAAFNGRVTSASRTERRDFAIQWRGSLFTIDSWVIMRGSPNRDAAYRFLAFASDPRAQAGLTALIPYAGTARGANKGLAPELLAASPANPDNLAVALLIDERFWTANLDRLSARFNAWLAR